jgi:hypothetical protein
MQTEKKQHLSVLKAITDMVIGKKNFHENCKWVTGTAGKHDIN